MNEKKNPYAHHVSYTYAIRADERVRTHRARSQTGGPDVLCVRDVQKKRLIDVCVCVCVFLEEKRCLADAAAHRVKCPPPPPSFPGWMFSPLNTVNATRALVSGRRIVHVVV